MLVFFDWKNLKGRFYFKSIGETRWTCPVQCAILSSVWKNNPCTELIWCDVRLHLVRPCGLSFCLLYEDQCRQSVWVHPPHEKTRCRWPCWQQCENYLWRRCTEQGSDTFLEQNEKKVRSKQSGTVTLNLLPQAEHSSPPEVKKYLM